MEKNLKDIGSEDVYETHKNEKQVQNPATWERFHSSALQLPTQFGHHIPDRLSVPPPILGDD